MIKKLYHGAAYYPELWPESEIDADISLMKEAGINVIRMGEFAWAKMEPELGQIDVNFFADVINRFYEEGIETVFCTPTATPPVWMSHGHPERMYVSPDRVLMTHGARQQCCTNNPFMRERTRIIVEALAKGLGRLPGVIAWQIDNEFKGHVNECCCSVCNDLWHEWLSERYGSIEKLNDAWGTEVWSMKYQTFEQVPQPTPTPFMHSASLLTCYKEFCRDTVFDYQSEQVEIILKYSEAPITHNGNPRHHIDHEKMYNGLDFAAFDDYHDCETPHGMVMDYDLWRNFKPGRPFWVMETSPSHNGCLLGYRRVHKEGYLPAEAAAAFAAGSEAFCYWLWRQQRTGVELPHGAVLSSYGKPGVGFEDVKKVNEMRQRLMPFLAETTLAQGDMAVVYSDKARAFFRTEPLEALNYTELMLDVHRIVLESGIHRDLIPEGHVLDGYKLLWSPFLPHLSDDLRHRAEAWVREGGVWIVGPLTGGRTVDHTLHTDAELGAKLESLGGIETQFSYSTTRSEETGTAFGVTAPLSLWSTFFQPTSAKVLGYSEGGRGHGLPFLTENELGKGKVVMLGAMPEGERGETMLRNMFRHYAVEQRCQHVFDVSKGTVAYPREDNAGQGTLIVVNMDGEGGSLMLLEDMRDSESNESIVKGELKLGPYEVRILTRS